MPNDSASRAASKRLRHELLVEERRSGEQRTDRRELAGNVLERGEALRRLGEARLQRARVGAIDRPRVDERQPGRDRERVLLDQERARARVAQRGERQAAQRARRDPDQRLRAQPLEIRLERSHEPLVELLGLRAVAVRGAILHLLAEAPHLGGELIRADGRDVGARLAGQAHDQLDAVGKDHGVDDDRAGHGLGRRAPQRRDALVLEVVLQLARVQVLEPAPRLGEQGRAVDGILGGGGDAQQHVDQTADHRLGGKFARDACADSRRAARTRAAARRASRSRRDTRAARCRDRRRRGSAGRPATARDRGTRTRRPAALHRARGA